MKTTIKDTATLDARDHYPEKANQYVAVLNYVCVRTADYPSPGYCASGDLISNHEQRLTAEVVSLRAQLHKTRFWMFLFIGAIGMQIILWGIRLGVDALNFITR